MMTVLSRTVAIITLLIALSGLTSGRQLLSESSPKYKLVRSVLDNIILAVGDGRQGPKLAVWSGPNPDGYRVAWYSPGATTSDIGIDESAVKLCLEFGPDSLNALAVLLGHEIAHYYRADTVAADFPRAFASAPLYANVKDLASQEKHVAIETDADLFGGFYGYLAGYNTLGVNARVLNKVYTHFDIQAKLQGYLNLGERQAIARSTRDSLSKLIPIVDAGTCLFALGKYTEAARCFDLVARKFPSRDMFNNAGVACALEAVQMSELHDMPFPYPFEFDVDMRLRSLPVPRARDHQKSVDVDKSARRSKLLLAAGEDFKQARNRDQGYATALVNLSCILDLMGGHDQAIAVATDAIALAKKTNDLASLNNAYQARCIAYWGGGDTSKANADSKLTRRYQARTRGMEKKSGGQEAIDGSHAEGFVFDPSRLAALVPGETSRSPAIRIYSQDLDDSHAILAECNGEEVRAIETLPSYASECNEGVRIGSRRGEVEERYGSPTSVRATSRGVCLVFEVSRICFWIGADDRVQGWMIYNSKD